MEKDIEEITTEKSREDKPMAVSMGVVRSIKGQAAKKILAELEKPNNTAQLLEKHAKNIRAIKMPDRYK